MDARQEIELAEARVTAAKLVLKQAKDSLMKEQNILENLKLAKPATEGVLDSRTLLQG